MKQARGVRLAAVAAVLLLAALAGCGQDNKVGDERLLDFEEQVGDRLGETTTTTAPPVTTTTAGSTQATKPGGGPQGTATTATTRTSATQPTATTATTAHKQEIPPLEIFIYDDDAPDKIDPLYGRMFLGGVVRWTNKDIVVRGVKATTTRFPCESIPPGGSCDFKPTAAGLFDYGDSTRPYVNAQLEVLPKE